MVLDAFSALSVACAVLQFVDFGTKLISKGKEYYKSADGVLADHAEQAAVSLRLAELNRRLSQSIPSTAGRGKLSPAEEALHEVTLDCMQYADDFGRAINELRVTGAHRKWKSFRQALKSVWKKEEIEERLVKLDRLRQQVVIHLLVVVNDKQLKEFKKIHADMNHLEGKIVETVRQNYDGMKQQIRGLSQSMSLLAKEQSTRVYDDLSKKKEARVQMVDQWRGQNEGALEAILEKVVQMDHDQKQVFYRRKILDSLYFEKIDDRQNMIDEKAQTTLEWVFEPPANTQPRWLSIPDWLQGSDGLYWVSGKAGSGKSTLMKWLAQEPRTQELLQVWAAEKTVLLGRYFFWISGKIDAQKSLSGLLRSILYDLLHKCPDMISQMSPPRWRSYDLELSHFPAWTNAELVAAIRTFIQHTALGSVICLFIDGLDEFDGKDNHRVEVMDLLKELSLFPNVKICVSSRPWELFKEGFAAFPKLRLEQLTHQDIENYINTNLQANEKFQALRLKNGELCSQLVSEIIEKAQGVWLWVILVVHSLLRGLRYKDCVTDLLDRLREIPEELEKYFLQMFLNIEQFYRPKALTLFRIALNAPQTTLSLMTLSFIDEKDKDFHSKIPTMAVPQSVIDERLELADTRLNVRCLGLLETVQSTKPVFGNINVEFLHRTARDFLSDPRTQSSIGMKSIESFDVDLFMCKSFLAQLKMVDPYHCSRSLLARITGDFMASAIRLESTSPESLMPLLSLLDVILTKQTRSQRDVVDFKAQSNAHPIVTAWSYIKKESSPLLPLCIQFGLRQYAKEVIQSSPELVKRPSSRPLLDSALRRGIWDLRKGAAEQLNGPVGAQHTPQVDLIRLILASGSDPNERLGVSTVWKRFMELLDTADFSRLNQQALQPWIEAAELCIRYGAVRVLETTTSIPNQSSGRTRVKLTQHQRLAQDSLMAAFGPAEATRLDSLAWRLNATGVNITTQFARSIRSILG